MPQLNEKSTVNAMLERETKRERIFEVREREVKRAKAQEEERKRREEREAEGDSKDKDAEAMRQLEEEFFRLIKDDVVSN